MDEPTIHGQIVGAEFYPTDLGNDGRIVVRVAVGPLERIGKRPVVLIDPMELQLLYGQSGELAWWRHFSTKLTPDSDVPQVGSALLGNAWTVRKVAVAR